MSGKKGADHGSSTSFKPTNPDNPLTSSLGPYRASPKQVAAVEAAANAAGVPVAEFVRANLLGAIALRAELSDPRNPLSLALHPDTAAHILYLLRTGGNVGK